MIVDTGSLHPVNHTVDVNPIPQCGKYLISLIEDHGGVEWVGIFVPCRWEVLFSKELDSVESLSLNGGRRVGIQFEMLIHVLFLKNVENKIDFTMTTWSLSFPINKVFYNSTYGTSPV